MPTFKKHIPNCCGGGIGEVIPIHNFSTVKEMLEIDYVKEAMETDNFVEFRFAPTRTMSVREVGEKNGFDDKAIEAMEVYARKLNLPDGNLMKICTDGSYWVMGALRDIGDSLSSLPVWKHEDYQEKERI